MQARHIEADSTAVVWRAIESYPDALARRLEREGFRHVEVINAGVIGYSSAHGLRLLALRIMDLAPDVVTVRFAANDAAESWAPERRTLEPANPVARAILYGLHDWRIVRLALRAYQSIPGVHPEPDSVRWTTPEQFRRNVERLAAVTTEHDVPLLLIDYPLGDLAWIPKPGKNAPLVAGIAGRLPQLREIVREVSEARGRTMSMNTAEYRDVRDRMRVGDVIAFSGDDSPVRLILRTGVVTHAGIILKGIGPHRNDPLFVESTVRLVGDAPTFFVMASSFEGRYEEYKRKLWWLPAR